MSDPAVNATSAGATASRNQWRTVLGAVILVALTVLLYRPALSGGFVWDDDTYIAQNSIIQSTDGLQRIWGTTESRDFYPVTLSLFWLEWHCWGTQTTGYHIVNLTLHLLNALLLWQVLQRLRVPGAWLAALLFAIHPLNVPSVAWLCELKNVLALFFALLTWQLYRKFDSGEGVGWYAAALLSFLLALLSKSAVAPWPLVMLACLGWQKGRLEWRDIRRMAPFVALSLGLGLVTIWFQHHRALEGATVLRSGFLTRLAGAGWAVWFYLFKALWPVQLSLLYEPWTLDPAARLGFLPLGLLAAGGWWLIRERRAWTRAVLLGFGCYVVLLLPVLGFIDQGFYAYALVADHWQYFALPALCALAGAAIATMAINPRLRPAAVLVTVAVGVGLSFQTRVRSRIFVSDEAAWRDTVEKSPRAWVARLNLANDLARRGQDALAVHHYFQALEINPRSAETHFNLAVVLARHGRTQAAIRHLATACQIRPTASWFQKLGTFFAERGEFDRAAAVLSEAIQLNSALAPAHYDLGLVLARLGRWEAAQVQYTAALQLTPNDGDTHYALTRTLLQLGQTNAAVAHYRAGLQFAPNSLQAGATLTNLLTAGCQP